MCMMFCFHFIICECSMPNFQVGFIRAVVQHWKNKAFKRVHSPGILVTSDPFFFSEVPYNVSYISHMYCHICQSTC